MDVDIIDKEIEICSAAPLVATNDFMQKLFVEVAGLYDEDDVDEWLLDWYRWFMLKFIFSIYYWLFKDTLVRILFDWIMLSQHT